MDAPVPPLQDNAVQISWPALTTYYSIGLYTKGSGCFILQFVC